jgi:F0F1-type ATP synthase membrane subunit c/vacuolar-type H+-ATPase subunit K
LHHLLEHLLVEGELRDETLETFVLGFQIPEALGIVGFCVGSA